MTTALVLLPTAPSPLGSASSSSFRRLRDSRPNHSNNANVLPDASTSLVTGLVGVYQNHIRLQNQKNICLPSHSHDRSSSDKRRLQTSSSPSPQGSSHHSRTRGNNKIRKGIGGSHANHGHCGGTSTNNNTAPVVPTVKDNPGANVFSNGDGCSTSNVNKSASGCSSPANSMSQTAEKRSQPPSQRRRGRPNSNGGSCQSANGQVTVTTSEGSSSGAPASVTAATALLKTSSMGACAASSSPTHRRAKQGNSHNNFPVSSPVVVSHGKRKVQTSPPVSSQSTSPSPVSPSSKNEVRVKGGDSTQVTSVIPRTNTKASSGRHQSQSQQQRPWQRRRKGEEEQDENQTNHPNALNNNRQNSSSATMYNASNCKFKKPRSNTFFGGVVGIKGASSGNGGNPTFGAPLDSSITNHSSAPVPVPSSLTSSTLFASQLQQTGVIVDTASGYCDITTDLSSSAPAASTSSIQGGQYSSSLSHKRKERTNMGRKGRDPCTSAHLVLKDSQDNSRCKVTDNDSSADCSASVECSTDEAIRNFTFESAPQGQPTLVAASQENLCKSTKFLLEAIKRSRTSSSPVASTPIVVSSSTYEISDGRGEIKAFKATSTPSVALSKPSTSVPLSIEILHGPPGTNVQVYDVQSMDPIMVSSTHEKAEKPTTSTAEAIAITKMSSGTSAVASNASSSPVIKEDVATDILSMSGAKLSSQSPGFSSNLSGIGSTESLDLVAAKSCLTIVASSPTSSGAVTSADSSISASPSLPSSLFHLIPHQWSAARTNGVGCVADSSCCTVNSESGGSKNPVSTSSSRDASEIDIPFTDVCKSRQGVGNHILGRNSVDASDCREVNNRKRIVENTDEELSKMSNHLSVSVMSQQQSRNSFALPSFMAAPDPQHVPFPIFFHNKG